MRVCTRTHILTHKHTQAFTRKYTERENEIIIKGSKRYKISHSIPRSSRDDVEYTHKIKMRRKRCKVRTN